MVVRSLDTMIGRLGIVIEDDRLIRILWEQEIKESDEEAPASALHLEAEHQLQEYFAGKRKLFDLPLAPRGTAFQLRVWQALQRIPYATTASYQQIAEAIGSPKACRAVGAANGANPLPIIVPCHRVIGKNGSLVGFGGDIDIKRQLLALEAEYSARFQV